MATATVQLVKLLLLALFIEVNSQRNLCKARFGICRADLNEPWGYRLPRPPPFWGLNYRMCYDQNQSPINIVTGDVEKDKTLSPLGMEGYGQPVPFARIENNGHTIEVVPGDNVDRKITVHGETYKLAQFHFHWGCDYREGSEHTVDGKSYAMELHLVHTNNQGDIAVVGFFMKEGDEVNEELQKIVDKLSQVRYKDTEADLNVNLDLSKLLNGPNSPPYYRYSGSLTTPPCSEGVTWSVVTEPIPVGRAQMVEFRKLYSATKENASAGCMLSRNYRPVQPLNDRTVKLSN